MKNISKEMFEYSLTKMAARIASRHSLKQSYAEGAKWGGPLGGLALSAVNLGARRPVLTLLGIGVPIATIMAANKLRGVFTIANETNKRSIMNDQTEVMRNIAYNTGRSQVPTQSQPTLYPMR